MNSLLFALLCRNVRHHGCTFLPPIIPLLTNSYQRHVSACPSVCPSSTSTLFTVSSTRSLDVYDTFSLSFDSSHNISTSSHPIITLLNNLKLLPCKGLVKKSAIILSVGQCLMLIFPCFVLLVTQKNLNPVYLDLLENDIFCS